MKQSDITAFFEQIAREFKPISHELNDRQAFALVSDESVETKIRENLDFSQWCLLIERAKPRVGKNSAGNKFVYRSFNFTVCKMVAGMSQDEKQTVRELSEFYGLVIFKKILEKQLKSKMPYEVDVEFSLDTVTEETQAEYYSNILNSDILGTDYLITIYEPFGKNYVDETLWN